MTASVSSTINEIVRPMERGQVTIPIAIRKKLGLTPQTWLWVKLIKNKILIEPVEKKLSPSLLADYLLSSKSSKKVYWQKEDVKALEKVRQNSKKRLESLV